MYAYILTHLRHIYVLVFCRLSASLLCANVCTTVVVWPSELVLFPKLQTSDKQSIVPPTVWAAHNGRPNRGMKH